MEFVTSDLDKAIEAAASRPLQRLVLRPRSTAGARLLSRLAQPYGAGSMVGRVPRSLLLVSTSPMV
jgi:hypothetical protein